MLLILYVAFVLSFVLVLRRFNDGGLGWYIASVDETQTGLNLGVFTLGYPSLVVLTALAIATAVSFMRSGLHLSASRAAAVLVIGLVLGASAGGVYVAGRTWPYHVQVSSGGFSLIVYYNSTTLVLGKNLVMKYVAEDNSYSMTTKYYYLFGAQFSMVFYNSTGAQVVAFRAPITFDLPASNYIVSLQPGEVWSTLLVWNGTIIGVNGTRTVAKPGNYELASYAVFQDANVSLYVDLQAPEIPVTIVSP